VEERDRELKRQKQRRQRDRERQMGYRRKIDRVKRKEREMHRMVRKSEGIKKDDQITLSNCCASASDSWGFSGSIGSVTA